MARRAELPRLESRRPSDSSRLAVDPATCAVAAGESRIARAPRLARSVRRRVRAMATNDETIVARLHPAERGRRDGAAFRVPPRNTEAEQALLGAVLVNNRAYERVSEFLRPEHFADPLHGRIFDACSRLIERGQIADGTTLKHVFDTDPEFADVGGADYIARLARAAVTVINAGDYGRIVYDLHLRRRLIDLGEDVVNDAYDTTLPESAGEQIQPAEQKLYELATAGDFEGGFQPFHDAIASAIDMAQSAFQREGRPRPASPPASASSTCCWAGCTPRTCWSWPAGRRWARPRWPPTSPSTPPSRASPAPRTGRSSVSSRWKCRPSSSPPASWPRRRRSRRRRSARASWRTTSSSGWSWRARTCSARRSISTTRRRSRSRSSAPGRAASSASTGWG